ncbi:MAG: pyridoxal phosphate-dependent aminotransferase [Sphaerochaetaceae bacterium]|nr:pyridoxal phosphate-dependent aminotransferase [Sphaerochaetaceae bacterium]
MKLSKRISSFQASPIRRLVPFSNEAAEKGIHVYHLNIGQPDIQTPPQVIEAIRRYDHNIIAYGQSEGDKDLRKALPAYYRRYNIEVTEDDIMITTGGSEAIQFVFMTLCDPGDEVIVPEPYYTNVGSFAKGAGVVLKSVTSSFDDAFRLPDIGEFESHVNERTRAIMLCSPNNPTGHVYTEKELHDILQLAKERDIFLIVDEVYREFCYDGEAFLSALTLTGYQDRIIVVDSFSKRYSMCGARIGTLVTKNREVLDGVMKLAQARLCPPEIEQIAALAALQTPSSYLDEVQVEYQKRRDYLVKRLQTMEGVSCSHPKGAFYLVARLPVDDAEDFCTFLLRDFSYRDETVMLAPAEGFYVTGGMGKNEVRIAYVLNIDDLERAMDCLENALEQYTRRTNSN